MLLNNSSMGSHQQSSSSSATTATATAAASAAAAANKSVLFNISNMNLIKRDRLLLNLLIGLSLNNNNLHQSSGDDSQLSQAHPKILLKLDNQLKMFFRFIDINLINKLSEFINCHEEVNAKNKQLNNAINRNNLINILKYQLDNQYNALLVLRNLAFNHLNKSKLITNGNNGLIIIIIKIFISVFIKLILLAFFFYFRLIIKKNKFRFLC